MSLDPYVEEVVNFGSGVGFGLGHPFFISLNSTKNSFKKKN